MRSGNSFIVASAGAAALVVALAGPRAAAQGGPYTQVSDIIVGGLEDASWEDLAVDTADQRLYVSHSVEFVVIDIPTEQVVGRIPEFQGAHGIAFAANGHGFATSAFGDWVRVIDLKTLRTLTKVRATNPGAVMYEPTRKEVYAFSSSGHLATVINSNTNTVVATIPLSGAAATAQTDPATGRVYVSIEDKDAVDVIDAASYKVVATWPIAPGAGGTGMAIDTAAKRLFISGGSGANPVMIAMDDANGRVVSTAPICSGAGATFYDSATKLIFTSCRDGKTTVLHLDAPNQISVAETLTTAPGSRTMALDPSTHRIYVGGAKPMAAMGGRAGRAQMDPNSFHVFVFGMSR